MVTGWYSQVDRISTPALLRLFKGGANYHDANFITFHRLKNFRALTFADSPPPVDFP